MKPHIKPSSYRINTTARCFVPVRASRSIQIPAIKCHQTFQAKLPTRSLFINDLRCFTVRSFTTDSQSNNKTDATVLQKQINVAMNEKDFAKAIPLLENLKNLSKDDKVVHEVYEKLGVCYQATSKLKQSIECYQHSLELSKKLNDPKKIAKSLSLLGALQVGLRDYESGNSTLKEGLKLATELKDPLLKGHINSSLGISFSNQEIPDAAIKYYMDSLHDFKEARNLAVVHRITRLIAQEYAKMNAFELSNTYWEEFLKFSRNTDDKESQFKALSQIANNFMRISKPRDSKITLEKAISLAKEMQNTEAERECLIGLAKACEVLGETDQAKKYSNEALKLSQDDMDVSGEINALIVRATQAVAAKDLDSCAEDAEKILELSLKNNHKGGEMYARILLGAVAEQSQEWTTAKDQFEKALVLAKAIKDVKSTRKCQDMLSVIYINLRDFATPVPILHDLLKVFESEKDEIGRLRCMSRLYLCYKNLGKQQHAEIYLKLVNILANQLVEQGVIPSLDELSGIIPTSAS